MTTFQALFVKYLRIRKEGTWRLIAIQYSIRYNGGYSNKGLQMYGLNLCNEAMNKLNEKVEDGWN